MPSAREFVECKVRAKLDAVATLAAQYISVAFPLRDGGVRAAKVLASRALRPLFTLDGGTMSILDMGHIEEVDVKAAPPSGVSTIAQHVRTPPDRKHRRKYRRERNAGQAQQREGQHARVAMSTGVITPASSAERGACHVADGGTGRDTETSQPARTARELARFRYYFDQENLQDADSAYVEFDHAAPSELLVVCPPRMHLRRRRYVRVLGTALAEHMAATNSFIVHFSPPQLNGIVALGCLGLYLEPRRTISLLPHGLAPQPHIQGPGSPVPHAADGLSWPLETTASFRVNKTWPRLCTYEGHGRYDSHDGHGSRDGQNDPDGHMSHDGHMDPDTCAGCEGRVGEALPPAQLYQFQILWHAGAFHSSYFDMIKGVFAWAWRHSPFRTEIATMRRRKELVLEEVDWAVLEQMPATTQIYCEYQPRVDEHDTGRECPGPGAACFFGTVGDVLSKRAMFNPSDPALRLLAQMRVYYLDPVKPLALAKYLNEREGAYVGPGANQPMPVLDPATTLQGMPSVALSNFARIWKPRIVEMLRSRISRDSEFAPSIIRHVPVDVRHIVRPAQGPRADADALLLAVVKAISLYPTKLRGMLQQ